MSPNLLFASQSSTPSVVIVGEVIFVGVLATTAGIVSTALAATAALPYSSCNFSSGTSVPSLRIILRKAA